MASRRATPEQLQRKALKREKLAEEAHKGWAEHLRALDAEKAKTDRLRAARLAREAQRKRRNQARENSD